jgi:hydrogenase expression/formation protein HypC
MCLAIPGRIVELLEKQKARVDVNGNMIEASIRLSPGAEVGDYVLLHAGFIMEIIDEKLALETIEQFKKLEAIKYG